MKKTKRPKECLHCGVKLPKRCSDHNKGCPVINRGYSPRIPCGKGRFQCDTCKEK